MGCFLACFGSKKKRRRRTHSSAKRVIPRAPQRNSCDESLQLRAAQKDSSDTLLQSDISLNKDQVLQRNGGDVSLEPTNCLNKDCTEKPIVESREKLDEQLSFNTRKKVTFDLNVKAYENISTQEIESCTSEYEEEKKDIEEKGTSTTTTTTTYPSNHRYQNCSNSDDEYEGRSDESDLDDDHDTDDYYSDDEDEDEDEDGDGHRRIVQDESSESFFSLPSALQQQGSETPLAEKEVNSPVPGKLRTLSSNQNARDRSQYVHSVLNPVENLTQWKAVKMKSKPLLKQEKENTDLEEEQFVSFSSEPSFKLSPSPFSPNSKLNRSESPKEDIAVDTSLSNWLGSSETTPSTKTSNLSGGIESAAESNWQRLSSPRNHEDRPILGALTIEEIRQFSATSSPRKSPSRSPDEMPILGTVGSYWSHTEQTTDSSSGSSRKGIPNTTSKYREDMRVNWHTTPFHTRLERALNSGEPDAFAS